MLELVLKRQEIGRPILFLAGVPAPRVEALRLAFMATLKDPEFLAEASSAGMEIEPLAGAQNDAMLAKAYGAPKEIVDRMVRLIEPPARGAKAAK